MYILRFEKNRMFSTQIFKKNRLARFALPPDVQVNRIHSPEGVVADWRIGDGGEQEGREATVFLDRKLHGELLLTVDYDRSLGATGEGQQLPLPLLRALDMHRQRGMVALLSGKELTLDPVEEGEANRVGENQLPPMVRQAVEMTVAHTFKYVEAAPAMTVRAAIPERQQGLFDARIDTLVSLGEVTMRGSSSLEITVKSGRIMELELELPVGVNVLGLTSPSLRTHRVEEEAAEGAPAAQVIAVEFTQEMEGQFRLELLYERILEDGKERVEVPTPRVRGAEVEQGRIAVEALSAVEVQAAVAEQLTSVEIGELPQQLILRTTNPILLAQKYVHAKPPPRLVLEVTRHKTIEVKEAAIDVAHYKTLFTRDGLAVTTASFTVRNSRKQFLRLLLPPESAVWSVFVDGRPEKPAEEKEGEGDGILIKIVTSTRGFPVTLVYQTKVPRIRGLSSVEAVLPRPDILVTRSRWDVYLPDVVAYGEPRSNMDVVEVGVRLSKEALGAALAEDRAAGQKVIEPLRIDVPASGVHFGFEKLYANQSDEDSRFTIPYASRVGAAIGTMASLVGGLLLLAGLALRWSGPQGIDVRVGPICVLLGITTIVVTVFFFRVSVMPVAILAIVGLAVGVLWQKRRRSPVEADGSLAPGEDFYE